MNGLVKVALAGDGLGDYIFGLDPQLLVDSAITILAMFAMFLLLSHLLFNPARDLLEKRQAYIKEQLEKAAKEKQDAIEFKAEYDEKLKAVDKEAEQILSQTRKNAVKRENEIVDEAKAEAARIVDRANHDIELEKSKVKDDVKKEMVSVATVMAEKIVASSLDEEKQSQLIADTLEDMAKLISKTYGDALFEVAAEEDKLESHLEEVEAVLDVLKENEEYIKIIGYPRIPVEEKKAMIESAFKDKVSDDMVGFLTVIVEKGRFSKIEEILNYFVERVHEAEKIGTAEIKSAVELSEAQKKAVEDKLLTTTQYKKIIAKYSVDESLIGGMVIRIGDRIVDSSVKTKLETMARDLSKVRLSN